MWVWVRFELSLMLLGPSMKAQIQLSDLWHHFTKVHQRHPVVSAGLFTDLWHHFTDLWHHFTEVHQRHPAVTAGLFHYLFFLVLLGIGNHGPGIISNLFEFLQCLLNLAGLYHLLRVQNALLLICPLGITVHGK